MLCRNLRGARGFWGLSHSLFARPCSKLFTAPRCFGFLTSLCIRHVSLGWWPAHSPAEPSPALPEATSCRPLLLCFSYSAPAVLKNPAPGVRHGWGVGSSMMVLMLPRQDGGGGAGGWYAGSGAGSWRWTQHLQTHCLLRRTQPAGPARREMPPTPSLEVPQGSRSGPK